MPCDVQTRPWVYQIPKKSRNGCHECKRRKVKCDEQAPRCRNCRYRRARCSFESQWAVAVRSPHHVAISDGSSGDNISLRIGFFSALDTFPLPNVKLSDAEYASVQDRELLHHYGTVAFRSFVDYDIYKRVWEVDVPREAISQRFLMHLVLAISALHVNHLRSSARNTLPYREMANRHYECAVAKFSLSVPQMTPLNASAVFAFSYLSVFFAFGSSQFCASRGKLEDPITELLDIFILLRKAMMTLKQAWSLVEGSVMGILLQRGPQITDRRYLPVETAAAVELMEDHCLQLLTVGTVDPELVMLYREAISQLWDCLVMAHTRRKDWSMALRFPIVCSDGFLARLSQRDPVALILLAHFCVILHKAPVRWWAQGWGKQVICAVFNNLPDSSRCAVAWPMEMLELNQVPRSPSRGNGRQ